MSEQDENPAREPSYLAAGSEAAPQPADDAAPQPAADARPYDPERGLRGVISAILIFEAVTILLGLTVLANGGRSAPAWELGTVTALALAHILTPALIRKRFVILLIFLLQAALIGCWAIHAAIGAMGIVFTLVWIGILAMRREFRRRMAIGAAAGTIAGAGPAPSYDDEETKQ